MYSEVFSGWPGQAGRIVSLSVMVALVNSKARQNKSRREAIRGEIIGLIFVSGSTDCSLHMHVTSIYGVLGYPVLGLESSTWLNFLMSFPMKNADKRLLLQLRLYIQKQLWLCVLKNMTYNIHLYLKNMMY